MKPIRPEIKRRRARQGGVFYRWRHPLVRDGEWSRNYVSRGAAATGMGLSVRYTRKSTEPQISQHSPGQFWWRHPLIRGGTWSRLYDSYHAAAIGMGIAKRRALLVSDPCSAREQPLSDPLTHFERVAHRVSRRFGDVVVSVVWNGTIYETVVLAPHRSPVKYLFCQLPDRFGFAPTSDYAFDITARSALHSAGK